MKTLKKTYIGAFIGLGLLLGSCEVTEVNEVIEVREVPVEVETAPENILFEVKVSFITGNDFSSIVDFPSDIEIFDTDLVVGYLMNGVDDRDNPIWDALPKTFYGDLGATTFNFNYSQGGVEVLLDAENGLDKNMLPEDFRIDRVFQFAIIPSAFNKSGKLLVDAYDYETVAKNARFVK